MKNNNSTTEKQRGLLLFYLIILGGTLLFPLIIMAGEYNVDGVIVHYEGLVPCGKSQPAPGEDVLVTMPCQLCHIFVMFDGIVDFILFKIVPPIAVLMLVIGGIMFIFAMFGGEITLPGGRRGGPALLRQAKALVTSVIIGLIIILAAWLIVNTLFIFLGLSDFGLSLTSPEKWNTINCQVKLEWPAPAEGDDEAGPAPAPPVPPAPAPPAPAPPAPAPPEARVDMGFALVPSSFKEIEFGNPIVAKVFIWVGDPEDDKKYDGETVFITRNREIEMGVFELETLCTCVIFDNKCSCSFPGVPPPEDPAPGTIAHFAFLRDLPPLDIGKEHYEFCYYIDVPEKPELVSPEDGEIVSDLNPTFTWENALHASSYWLRIKEINEEDYHYIFWINPAHIVDHRNPIEGPLLPDTTYVWEVQTRGPCSFGAPVSEWTSRTFTTPSE